MDIVIEFFRDTLDGPFYIVWVIFCVILIFACIGYLAEKGIKNKKEKEKYATVSDTNNTEVVQEAVVSDAVNTTQVESTPVTTPIAEPVSVATSENGVNNAPATQDTVVSEPVIKPVDSTQSVEIAPVIPTVSEVVSTPVQNISPVVDTSQVENVIPQVEVTEPNNTVISPPDVQVTNVVSTDNVSTEASQVVIPTINQGGNNNTV